MIAGAAAIGIGSAGRTDIRNVHLSGSLTAKFIDLGNKGHIHQIALANGGAFRGGREINGIEKVPSAAQAQAHMPSAAHQIDPIYSQIFHHKQRLGTAVAARLQGGQGVDIVKGQQLRGYDAIGIQYGAGGVLCIIVFGFFTDSLPESGDL